MESNVSFVEHQVAFSFIVELRRQTDRGDDLITWFLPSPALPAGVDYGLYHVKSYGVDTYCLEYMPHLGLLCVPPSEV